MPAPLAPMTAFDPLDYLAEQQAILREAPDGDTAIRRQLASALRRIAWLELQLKELENAPARPGPRPSLRQPILTLLQERRNGLTLAQIEEAMERRGLADTLRRMVGDGLLVRQGTLFIVSPPAGRGPGDPPTASTASAPVSRPQDQSPAKRGRRARVPG